MVSCKHLGACASSISCDDVRPDPHPTSCLPAGPGSTQAPCSHSSAKTTRDMRPACHLLTVGRGTLWPVAGVKTSISGKQYPYMCVFLSSWWAPLEVQVATCVLCMCAAPTDITLHHTSGEVSSQPLTPLCALGLCVCVCHSLTAQSVISLLRMREGQCPLGPRGLVGTVTSLGRTAACEWCSCACWCSDCYCWDLLTDVALSPVCCSIQKLYQTTSTRPAALALLGFSWPQCSLDQSTSC